jgi:hypothetical protein
VGAIERAAKVVPVFVATLLVASASASAADPWLVLCTSKPKEQPLPRPVREAALRFFPWVRPAADGLRFGPVYLIALSSRTAVSRDGDEVDGAGFYLHRAVVAIAPTYSGALTLSGRRLGGSARRAALGFATNGATTCTVDPPRVDCGSRPLRFAPDLEIARGEGWRIVRTELRIGRTGCFRITAIGAGLNAVIPLAVPGPDYGTAGW